MSRDLKPMQTLLLLDLLSRGGEATLQDVNGKSGYDAKAVRAPLRELGLVREGKERVPGDKGRRPKTLTVLTLTDMGWAHIEGRLRVKGGGLLELPPASRKCAPIMARLLGILGSNMHDRDIAIGEILCPSPGQKPPPRPHPPATPTADAFYRMLTDLHASRQLPGGGLRIAAIRKAMPGITREETDRLLLDLQRQERVVLYSFASNELITQEDRDAAVIVAREPRHVMYLK
ncbi:MAG: hypothetical protein LBG06_06445 [Deltaproteobacteria bacterium]|jgi:hypothetical protein|nr:hypothetical protein [Deltaproteobacteria bacterium]